MPSCALRYCINNSRNISKSQGVTFHQFPQPCHETRDVWIDFVRRKRGEETWLPSDYTRICSVHFKEADKYITKTGRVYLKRLAIPHDNETIAASSPKECQKPEPGTIEIIPEGRLIIAKVFHYLQQEYDTLKASVENQSILKPLSNILLRTADATGVTEDTVSSIVNRKKRTNAKRGPKPGKRKKKCVVEEDEISPIEEESSDEEVSNISESTVDNGQQEKTLIEIETLKVELDTDDDYRVEQRHANESPHSLYFTITPLDETQKEKKTNKTNSSIQNLISHANVKTEPVNLAEGQKHSRQNSTDSLSHGRRKSSNYIIPEIAHVTVKNEPVEEDEEREERTIDVPLINIPLNTRIKMEPEDCDDIEK